MKWLISMNHLGAIICKS